MQMAKMFGADYGVKEKMSAIIWKLIH